MGSSDSKSMAEIDVFKVSMLRLVLLFLKQLSFTGFLKVLSLARILGNPMWPRSSLRNYKRFLLLLKAAKICLVFLLSCLSNKNRFIRVNSLDSIKFSVCRSVTKSRLFVKLSSKRLNSRNHASSSLVIEIF